jgi:hypothetical protein
VSPIEAVSGFSEKTGFANDSTDFSQEAKTDNIKRQYMIRITTFLTVKIQKIF